MVKAVRFANDKAVVAISEKVIQEMMDNIKDQGNAKERNVEDKFRCTGI